MMNEDYSIIKAIKSLYRLMVVVDVTTRKCSFLDFDCDIKNISKEIVDFDELCEQMKRNTHPEDRDEIIELSDPDHIMLELGKKAQISFDCRLRLADDHYCWNEITICPLPDTSEDKFQFLFLVRDIHSRKVRDRDEIKDIMDIYAEIKEDYEELFEENMRDAQTGCYNRKGLNYYTEISLRGAKERGLGIFVCVVDLNGLKHINDTYGHTDGDIAIETIANELKKNAPEGAAIVRTGGDEFLVFAPMEENSSYPEVMGNRIDEDLKEFNLNHDYPYDVAASYGWSIFPVTEEMRDLDECIEVADAKMYDMKCKRDEYRRS